MAKDINSHICPLCGSNTKVTDSRYLRRGWWRRRECLSCQNRHTTYEIMEADLVDSQRTHVVKRLERFKQLLWPIMVEYFENQEADRG